MQDAWGQSKSYEYFMGRWSKIMAPRFFDWLAANKSLTWLDEGIRFPICNEESLESLFNNTGLCQVSTTSLDIITRFKDFDDFWNPFLGGQGPAPG